MGVVERRHEQACHGHRGSQRQIGASESGREREGGKKKEEERGSGGRRGWVGEEEREREKDATTD